MSVAVNSWIESQRAKSGLPMARAAWQNARWLDGTGKASDILAAQLLKAGREMPAQGHGRT